MSTTNALPACDCLNDCGDDPRLKNGKVAACDNLKKFRERSQQQALEFVRVNLIMQQYGVTTVYDLIEHLHTKVEQLPTNIDPRWANIDFGKVNAELRDMRAQIERLQAHIDRTQPIQAGADGYVQPQAQGLTPDAALRRQMVAEMDMNDRVLAAIEAESAPQAPKEFNLATQVQIALVRQEAPQAPAPRPVRCPLCNYQHGHQIGCENNPVDIALKQSAPHAPEVTNG